MATANLRDYTIAYNLATHSNDVFIYLKSGIVKTKTSYASLPTYTEILSSTGRSSINKIYMASYVSQEYTGTFWGCTKMTIAPEFPSDYSNATEVNLNTTFYGCTALTTAPTLPENSNPVESTFRNCSNLTGDIYIPDSWNIGQYNYVFTGTSKSIVLYGRNKQSLINLCASSSAGNVTYQLLTPIIPVKVDGVWVDATSQVKVNNTWVQTYAIHIKQNNTWTEI